MWQSDAGTSTVIICALGACTQKLRLKGIDVLNPSKLKAAADVSVVCFDKTGTLTGSVVGPNSLHHGCYQHLRRPPDRHHMAIAGA